MINAVFVPLTDELMEHTPEPAAERLVPYNPELPCYRWLSVEIDPRDDQAPPLPNRGQG